MTKPTHVTQPQQERRGWLSVTLRPTVLLVLAAAAVLAAGTPAAYAQTTTTKASATSAKKRTTKMTPSRAATAATARISKPPTQDPLQRRALSSLGHLKGNSGPSTNSLLGSRSRLGESRKAGTAPLDRWSMTRQKQTMRAWQKAREQDNRGRSLLPKP